MNERPISERIRMHRAISRVIYILSETGAKTAVCTCGHYFSSGEAAVLHELTVMHEEYNEYLRREAR